MEQLSLDITGVVRRIDDTEVKSERFQKRDFVLEVADDPKYPQYLLCTCVNKKTDILDGISLGSLLKARINLQGKRKEYKDGIRYFNSLSCWAVDVISHGDGAQATSTQPAPSEDYIQDDIPF